MKMEIDVKPTVGQLVTYTPPTGPAFDVTVEKVIDDETIDAVTNGNPRFYTPTRFPGLKHGLGAPNTWCYTSEFKSSMARPAIAAPAPPPPPPPPAARSNQ